MTVKARITRYVAGRRRPATRIEIARALRVSENTVNGRVRELLDAKVLAETPVTRGNRSTVTVR